MDKKETRMGTLRPTAKWKDEITKIWKNVRTDCPMWPAQILLDDIEQEIIIDSGFDPKDGKFYYKIEPYPESHHLS